MIECMRTDAKKPEPEQWILKEYLFRGERRDDREWVEGFLFVVNDVPYILPHHNTGQPIHADNLLKTAVEVLKDTVCRCTGQYDKNGKLIWEDDIVKCGNTTELVGIKILQAGVCPKEDGSTAIFTGMLTVQRIVRLSETYLTILIVWMTTMKPYRESEA